MACPARCAAIARPPPRVRRRTAATVATPRPTLILVGMQAHTWAAMAIADLATMAVGIVEGRRCRETLGNPWGRSDVGR